MVSKIMVSSWRLLHRKHLKVHFGTQIWENGPLSLLMSCRHFTVRTKLEPVGVFGECIDGDKYKTGQTFLHQLFAYRGIILFPWTVQIFERKQEDISKPSENEEVFLLNKSIPQFETYYQVLVDSRDSPHIAVQSEAVTFLSASGPGAENQRSLYTIPGIDYVSHNDILPYTSVESIPIQHELFDKFLERASTTEFSGTETLKKWQVKNHSCLELNKVHKETTFNIKVTAMPFFLGFKESSTTQPAEYWWRYCIRIENLGSANVRLRERHWRIISNGSVKTVRGRGVIGREPLLSGDQPAFQYSSHISLQAPNGHMWGIFRLETENGEQFDVRIPAFALESKPSTSSTNSDV